MARIKLAYIGGGSTRAAGTMASFVEQGENFNGSEVVLVDLDEDHLAVVQTISQKMAHTRGLDLTITCTTDRRGGLQDCDAVLTSFRHGGFAARHLDESIPPKYGVIGQETQGPGGFFMALRSIHVIQDIIKDIEEVCPGAWLFNYTNPVNIVSQAVTHHSAIPTVSLCEGPIVSNRSLVELIGLDSNKLDAVSIGLNHASWSVRHLYDGHDVMPMLEEGYQRLRDDPQVDLEDLRLLELACRMRSLPSSYFQYYYFKDEIAAELQNKPTTRAQDIMASVPDYWTHYREQAASDRPQLDPNRSRGGIHELELGIDVMDAIFNDRRELWYVNVPNRGSIEDFPDDMVVETVGYVERSGISPLVMGHLHPHVSGLVKMLGEYQALTAEAAWSGNRQDAVRALASHPLVLSLHKAEAIYDEMAAAHRNLLPDRLLH
jgi:6-phospho-beta-glucosidase